MYRYPYSALNSYILIGLLLAGLCTEENLAVASDHTRKGIRTEFGKSAENRVKQWQDLIKNNKNTSDWNKLNGVNKFFNRITWVSDEEHWKQRDYWATPLEMLETNGGDCEDYAIAKYVTLKELGVSEDKLRITYVIAGDLQSAHMVLAYYETLNAEPLILDNLTDRVTTEVARYDLKLMYAFNSSGFWSAGDRGRESQQDSKQVFQWQELNVRLALETDQENSAVI